MNPPGLKATSAQYLQRASGCLWDFHSHGGTPYKWMVYFMENPMKMDDLDVPPWIGNFHM